MKLFLPLLLLLLPPAAFAQSSLPRCEGEFTRSVWSNCQGEHVYPNGERYSGEFKDGLLSGFGAFTYQDGRRFVGSYKEGARNGGGVLYRGDGSVDQSGHWVGGRLIQSFPQDPSRYPFGAQVSSGAENPSRNTLAIEEKQLTTLPNCPSGYSEGSWSNCQGTITFPNGETYFGAFKDGKADGFGKSSWAAGNNYVGEFKAGRQSGQGIYTYVDGTKKSGLWKEGRLVQSYPLVIDGFTSSSSPSSVVAGAPAQVSSVDPARAERDRLAAEVENERRKRQELEQLLAQAQQGKPAIGGAIPTQRLNAHALVIGNAAYPGALRLPNPTNDARAMSDKLRSLGFTVTEVGDANRARLVQALSQFNRSAAKADLTLLFYSGHGVQILGTNYILPTDVDQSDVAQATIQGISLNSVVEQFMPGPTKIVFLDACRDNPLAMSNTRSVSRGLAPINVSQGTLISYATKDGQTASDGLPGQKLSPFTTALLEHLGDPDDIAVVLRKVRDKVMRATGGKQQPWDYGSLSGGALVLSNAKR